MKNVPIILGILFSSSCCAVKISSGRALLKRLVADIVIGSSFISCAPLYSYAEDVRSVMNINVVYDGLKSPVSTYLGTKATLIVNVNSQCDIPADGEPQCKGLADLFKKHKNEGFQILAFPSDQFRDKSMLGESEPIEDVRKSLSDQYGWDFPIFDFVDVNGGNTAEIFKVMKEIKSINPSDLKKINWNYEKFLIDSEGIPVRRYRPSIMPIQLDKDITDLINTGKLKPRVKAALGAV